MSETDANTWALTPPRGPSLATDFHGGVKINLGTPNYTKQISCEEYNSLCKTLVGTSAPAHFADISVKFTGAVPLLDIFACANENVVSTDITVTDGGTGITTITCAAAKFPSVARARAAAGITGATPGLIAVESTAANIFVVRTLNAAGAAADLPFTLYIT